MVDGVEEADECDQPSSCPCAHKDVVVASAAAARLVDADEGGDSEMVGAPMRGEVIVAQMCVYDDDEGELLCVR